MTTLHPIFAEILAMHGMPQAQQFFDTQNGDRGRAYLSERDAMAYDVAYSAYPIMPSTPGHIGPAWDGYFDAARAARERAKPVSMMFRGDGFFVGSGE